MRQPQWAVVALASLAALALAGCTTTAALDDGAENYVSGDGTVTEFALESRPAPLEFSGDTDLGTRVASADYLGSVTVVNFWYAACPPCRLEAPWLKELNDEYGDAGVEFLGVNIRDGVAASLAFADRFGIEYPSIVDDDGQTTLAFTGLASPTAVPTTIVLDTTGRPAARIVGLIDKSVLATLIETTLAEPTAVE